MFYNKVNEALEQVAPKRDRSSIPGNIQGLFWCTLVEGVPAHGMAGLDEL